MKRLVLIVIAIMVVVGTAISAFAAERTIVRIASDVKIERGTTVNDVVVIDGKVDVSGNVDGNIVVLGGSLKLGPGVKVARHVVLIGAAIDRDPSAVIGGKVTEVGMPSCIPFAPSLKNLDRKSVV